MIIQGYFNSALATVVGVVIDGKVVHAGGVPGRGKIEQWLAAGVRHEAPAPVPR